MAKLMSWLSDRGVLVADGATGTMLQKQGLPPGMAPERWNLEHPDAVTTLYRVYVEAGSDLILTNTFGGSSVRLRREGLAERVREMNRTAAELAVKAAGDVALVVGDIGPTGEMLAPLGLLAYEDAVAAFAEQAAALVEGGVDAILIETMSDLSEMQAAVEGVRQVTDLPLLGTMSFDTKGRTMMGVKPEQAVKALQSFGVDVIGANCGRTLTETLEAVVKMRQAAPDALLMAKPNAGLPHAEGQNLVYDVTPDVMAEYARRFVEEAGIKIFGGCCGSTPEHITAIAGALRPGRSS
jgi:5-methyltetrahydrofolate--homocysteine methyltransferase